ncbi:MAG: anhydro-N-acetylmuramic acid kinase [Chloroflexota bacterium]|nr:anhydro-N-acetylmuramic acid kinase [Chloroflexota bacterium]
MSLRVLGLMSGTSADGIDAALCVIDGAPPHLTARIVRSTMVPYPGDLRGRVLDACQPGAIGSDALCMLNFAIGEAFADAAARVIDGETVDLIASHGQTIWHNVTPDGRVNATLQIGSGAVIAERTGVTVIDNFRVRDVAAGGQGAPLVAYVDHLLLRHPTLWRAAQNIGGIGNVTFLAPLTLPDAQPIAFDTGPGNALIDALMVEITGGRDQYDRGGAFAASGALDRAWLDDLLTHPYFARAIPKTTGRELFGVDAALRLMTDGRARGLSDADIAHTLTALTAHSIADAYARFAPAPIGQVIVAGGGVRNPTLMAMLASLLRPGDVLTGDDAGMSADFKEALAFAVLGYETWHNRVGALPSQTGARRASVLGQITPGDNYAALIRRTWMA